MTTIILTAVFAAIVSSGLTLVIGYWLFISKVLPALSKQLDNEVLPQFREQVALGAKDAGAEMLPQFRENVRLGFQDTMRDGMGTHLAEGAAKTMAKSVERGFSTFLGK